MTLHNLARYFCEVGKINLGACLNGVQSSTYVLAQSAVRALVGAPDLAPKLPSERLLHLRTNRTHASLHVTWIIETASDYRVAVETHRADASPSADCFAPQVPLQSAAQRPIRPMMDQDLEACKCVRVMHWACVGADWEIWASNLCCNYDIRQGRRRIVAKEANATVTTKSREP